MADRILTWHIPGPGASLPAHYMEKDYVPSFVRIYAESAPSGKDFEVEIRDDGVSIFAERDTGYNYPSETYSQIAYNNLSGTFSAGEIISGGTSGALGTLVSDRLGNMELSLRESALFSVGETITGQSSSATATVLSYYHGDKDVPKTKQGVVSNTAVLSQGMNLDEAADYFPLTDTTILAGSVLTCYVPEMGGALNVTVQLELDTADENSEVI